eukprot:GHUV01049017.1.p1 GENE.GHUV01049017.1~~GHUV01049017.1.p1  ORF type:complete len:108 (-),score=9.79 GHUV01049017.1:340-663(-)
MASQFTNLTAFVHVSTFFVNNNLPRNSLVKEQIYELPLSLDGVTMSHEEYVTTVLAMDRDQANKHTAALMQPSISLPPMLLVNISQSGLSAEYSSSQASARQSCAPP